MTLCLVSSPLPLLRSFLALSRVAGLGLHIQLQHAKTVHNAIDVHLAAELDSDSQLRTQTGTVSGNSPVVCK